MKHLITFLLVTTMSFAQTVVTTPELKETSSIEQTIVSYTTDFIESSKTISSSIMELVVEGVDLVVLEGTILVKQYLMFKSITYGIPVLLGIYLVFFLSRRLYKFYSINVEDASLFNDKIFEEYSQENAKNSDPNWKQSPLQWKGTQLYIDGMIELYFGRYYKDFKTFLLGMSTSMVSVGIGLVLLSTNLIPFIKVTFFSKLYLAELVIKYLEVNV
jgi:hypothetical protein